MDIEEMQRAVGHFMAEPWLNTLLDVLEEYRTIKNVLHTLEKERDEALARLAAMESQEPIVAYKIDDGTTSGYVFTDHQGIVELEELYGVKSTPLVECKPARITEQDALPDGYREEWKRHVMIMWACARKHDSSIPSDVLDYMRDQLLNKLNADREQVTAVAVPEKLTYTEDDYSEEERTQMHGYINGWNDCVDAILAAAPSHSQQSAATDAERFCDSHCTWRDHHPDCPSPESEVE